MPATAEQCSALRARLKCRAHRAVASIFAEVCGHCGADGTEVALELAHVRPTTLSGPGRGQDRRFLDAIRHPEAYALLCPDCHGALDGRIYRRPRNRKRKPR